MGTLNRAESHSSQNEGFVSLLPPMPLSLPALPPPARSATQQLADSWRGRPLPSQLRSKPGSSSPKFALRLLMPLLVRRVLPPGGLTWPTASTPPSSELVTLASIMNMAQFANKVIGQPITNWDASGTTPGFARGNVGFLAVGDLGKDFNTGLPDGEYCDIIRDCSQKIQISGGRGYFNSPDDDPVVAICVGC